MKLYNGYREPLPKASKLAQRVKQGNPRIDKAHNTLLKAIDDVEKVRLPKGDVGIGVAFVSPGIKEEYEPEIEEIIKGTIETAKRIAKQIKSDAIAWSAPALF